MEGFIFSEDLCRLCLWRSNKLLPIFSEEGELQGIPLKIGMCLPISVTRDDVLPKLICSQCIYKLEMFSEFRNSCVRSEQLLKRYTTHEPPVQSCHTVVVQMQEELKAEVPEPDPIAIEPQVPYMCIIPEVQKPVEEPPQLAPPPPLLPLPPPPPPPPQPPQASVESTNTNIDTKEGIIPTKKVPKKKQKVARRNAALKKQSSNVQIQLPIQSFRPKHIVQKHRGVRGLPQVPSLATSRRSMHRCKHCAKNFPSRVQLSRHLTSSNCLFRYTCRYCAKIFGSAENRIQHERNHSDKKNFICRVCKQKFQSSFDLNVHTVHGCDRSTVHQQSDAELKTQSQDKSRVHSRQQGKAESKKQVQDKNRVQNVTPELKKHPQDKSSEKTNETKQSEKRAHFKCKYCDRDFKYSLSLRRHTTSHRRSMTMSKVHEVRRRAEIKSLKKTASAEAGQKRINRTMQRMFPDGLKMRPPSRRKQNLLDIQKRVLENSVVKNVDISPKASLLAVLGLKEKSKPVNDLKSNRTNTDSGGEDEVVTVCDICRKIFTSESGMLNHQSTVHNRNLTAERMNTLMRVEI